MEPCGLKGPWELTEENINKYFPNKKSGNFILFVDLPSDTSFVPRVIGRDDLNLNGKLHGYTYGRNKYFMAKHASSTKVAFEIECQHWHKYGGPEGKLENTLHPIQPDDKNYDCPVEGCNEFNESQIFGDWV